MSFFVGSKRHSFSITAQPKTNNNKSTTTTATNTVTNTTTTMTINNQQMHSHREKQQPQPEPATHNNTTHTCFLTTLARMRHTRKTRCCSCFCFASDLRCCSLLSVLVFCSLLSVVVCYLLAIARCSLLLCASATRCPLLRLSAALAFWRRSWQISGSLHTPLDVVSVAVLLLQQQQQHSLAVSGSVLKFLAPIGCDTICFRFCSG